MKKTILITTMLLAGGVQALENENYFGASFQYGQLETSSLGVNPANLNFKLGRTITDRIAIEGQFILGLSEGKKGTEGIKVDRSSSLFIKADALELNKIKVYGLLGYSEVRFEFNAYEGLNNSFSSYDEESGVSYGFGSDYYFDTNASASVEYISYFDKNGANYEALNLGYNIRF